MQFSLMGLKLNAAISVERKNKGIFAYLESCVNQGREKKEKNLKSKIFKISDYE